MNGPSYELKSSNGTSPIHFLNPRKGHFIKVEFKVLQIDCEYGVNGFFLQEDEITSDAICGTNRQYAPIFSTDDELTLSFYNMREEVKKSNTLIFEIIF